MLRAPQPSRRQASSSINVRGVQDPRPFKQFERDREFVRELAGRYCIRQPGVSVTTFLGLLWGAWS